MSQDNCTQELKFDSEIKKFFKNKSLLITGSTGLVGKVLIWKLLNSCDQLDRIYLLIRPKKGLTIDQRLDDLLNKSRGLFNYNNVISKSHKIIPIQGDIGLPDLGLSQDDKQIIIQTVSIVVHSAADITFETDLK